MVNGGSLLLGGKGREKLLGSKRVFDHHRALDVVDPEIGHQRSKLVKNLKSNGAMEHIMHGVVHVEITVAAVMGEAGIKRGRPRALKYLTADANAP
jgi:hypothetical protein